MLDLVDPNISRVSNAYVESHHKNFKYGILKEQSHMSIGQTVRRLRDNVGRLVFEANLGFKDNVDTNIKGKKKCKYPTTDSINFVKDVWKRGQKEGRSTITYLQGSTIRRTVEKVLEEKKSSKAKKKKKYISKTDVAKRKLKNEENNVRRKK